MNIHSFVYLLIEWLDWMVGLLIGWLNVCVCICVYNYGCVSCVCVFLCVFLRRICLYKSVRNRILVRICVIAYCSCILFFTFLYGFISGGDAILCMCRFMNIFLLIKYNIDYGSLQHLFAGMHALIIMLLITSANIFEYHAAFVVLVQN